MKSTIRAVAALALLGILAGCAQLGIPTPSGIETMDTPTHDAEPSD